MRTRRRRGSSFVNALTTDPYGDRAGEETKLVASAITASAGHHGYSSPRGDGSDNLVVQCGGGNIGEIGAFVLEGQASNTTRAGRETGHARTLDTRGDAPTPRQGGTVVAYDIKGSAQHGPWHASVSVASTALQSKGAKPTGNEAGTIIAFDPTQDPCSGDVAPSLQHEARAESGPGGVRRLTPLECERLMALPDGHTCLCGCEPYSTEACSCPDGPRYKQTGNGVVVDVIEWIGRRLMEAQ